MNDLAGRVALVTGGGSGIGAACARRLGARGATVVVTDIDLDAAKDVAADLEGGLALRADVTDPESVIRMVRTIEERAGRLDIAVNNAGVGVPDRALVGELTWQQWRRVLDINLDGVFGCLSAEIPAMLRAGGGSIVNVASVMGQVAARGAAAYVSSKHAVIGLTKAAALDYADAGIRVNAVGPAFIDTPLIGHYDQDAKAAVAAAHPVGRLGTSEEIAAVVAFLASPESSFVTGALYLADGGYTVA